ncbi:MAG: hypothetical protein JETCAE03_35260 [Ignavibacteriaceae bacterium]|nr:MAG: hypothetical protein JETCAE03_35260 [Ignavibacteriaceae bacterium]
MLKKINKWLTNLIEELPYRIFMNIINLREDYNTWTYYKDKDLLMRKETAKEHFFRFIFSINKIIKRK